MEIEDLLDTARVYYGCCYRCKSVSRLYEYRTDAQEELEACGWTVIDEELICGGCK